ncbi:MAG: LptF/LptG family permease, partial [Candidatus Acidiferrales bacterium]
MRLLDRYILREITGYTILSLGVFLFILLTPEVLRLSELLARENVALPQMAKLLLSALPAKLAWAIPLGVLGGLLMGLSRV